MEEKATLSKVAMHITQGCLVVPVQVEFYDEVALQIQVDILERVRETGVRGVIIDVSGVDIIDSFVAQTISDTARMASLLGAKTVLTGLKPGVVASLVDLDIEFKDIHTAITLEEGFQKLKPFAEPKEKPKEIEETEDEAAEAEGSEYEIPQGAEDEEKSPEKGTGR